MQPEKAPSPTWLKPLLAIKFFETCEKHTHKRKNEENLFCMDCACRLCPNCLVEHTTNEGTHNFLQIRQYVHSDVVHVHDVIELLDVAQIQTYVANGTKVIHLNPKNSKPSPKGAKSYVGAMPCVICARSISKPNLFCSIACKITSEYPDKEGINGIEANGNTCDDRSQPVTGVKRCSSEDGPSSTNDIELASEKTNNEIRPTISFRKRSRKGIPVRSLSSLDE